MAHGRDWAPGDEPLSPFLGSTLDNRYAVPHKATYHDSTCQIEGCTMRAVAWLDGPMWRVCNYHSALYAARRREQKRWR